MFQAQPKQWRVISSKAKCRTLLKLIPTLRERLSFRVIAILGALCLVITRHGIYNVLVNQQGFVAWIGYTLPLAIGAVTVLIRRKIYGAVALVPRD